MDHVHKSTAGKSRLTKEQAQFRGELVSDSLVKRRQREMVEACDKVISELCRNSVEEHLLRETFKLVHAVGVMDGIKRLKDETAVAP